MADAPRPIDPELRALTVRHAGKYSDEKFWKKVKRWAKRAGKAVIKHALGAPLLCQRRRHPGVGKGFDLVRTRILHLASGWYSQMCFPADFLMTWECSCC